ncbi:MAG: type IV pilus assembly protein PilM, partial [bacterium]
MAHNLIGVDLGSQTVKLVAFKIGERGPLLTHLAVKAIPWEEEKDLSFGKEVLKAIFHEINLKPQKVRLVCSGTGMHIRRLSLPAMPPEELKEAVRWELKNQIPQSIEAMEVRFHILGEKPEEGGSPRLDLIAVACPQSTLERLLTIAAKAEIKPTHLDVAPFALWNLILTCQENASAEDLAILDMGAEKTGIYIWQKGVLQFSREIIPGGADFTRAIREGLDPGEKPHLLFTRAEKIKQIIGIPVQGPFPSIPGESISIAKITFLMRPVLERLVGEISRSLEYFRAQISGKNIDRLLLCGGGANMKNMAFYLSQELRLPVERFNPWKFLPFDPQNIDPQ